MEELAPYMIVEHEVVIRRPVAEVFAYLEDQGNATAWREGVVSVERLSPGADLRGATFREVAKTPMGQGSATYEVTEVVPDERIEFEVTAGPLRPHGILLLRATDDGGGTRLSYRVDTRARGFAAVMEKGFAKLLNDMIVKSAENVKSRLEGLA